ncbi:MAG: DUF3488 and DUF4129 domain-containing transglutaminase family protein [Gammaproteobacteria bacterium]
MKRVLVPWQPRPSQWWGLALAMSLSAAPHLLRLPAWLMAIWVLAVGWRLALGAQGRRGPALLIRGLVTLATALALFLYFGTVFGRDAGSALLVMMVGLKLLEVRYRRDATLLMLMCYLLLGFQFMFDQSVLQVGYALVSVLAVTAVWVELCNPLDAGHWREDLGLAARLLAQAVPMMLVLFILFPRLPGPLWSLPADAHSARTGLSDELEPGRISQLALSEAVAFRADFAAALPPPAQRYWRGPVFEETDGRRWWAAAADPEANARPQPAFQAQGPAYHYVITLEPSSNPWLPALEMATRVPEDAIRLATLELKARRAVDSLRRDAYTSHPDYRADTPDAAALSRNLRVPERTSERVRTLARAWRRAAADDRAVIAAALGHFRQQPFVYTLEPPLLGSDPVDGFLFETRRGFCEHYAAAFTLLMRAAGLPARIVTGYQGGEVNPVGDYLIVRQSDAHAWSEVWLDDAGWVRVDPTAAVAPERVERRIPLGRGRAGAAILFDFDETGLFGRAQRLARFTLDALNNGWNQWVISYSPQRQQNLLDALGLAGLGWQGLAGVLLGAVGAVLVGLAGGLLWRRPAPGDPVGRLYARFRQRLAGQGLIARPEEGPCDLLARIERTGLPTLAAARRITALYIALRYAPRPDPGQLRALRAAVKAF